MFSLFCSAFKPGGTLDILGAVIFNFTSKWTSRLYCDGGVGNVFSLCKVSYLIVFIIVGKAIVSIFLMFSLGRKIIKLLLKNLGDIAVTVRPCGFLLL